MEPDTSSARLFARNTAFLFLAQLLTKGLGFVSLILLANYLTVDHYGLYNFALAFGTLFIPLFDLGMDTFLTREIAANPTARERLSGNAIILKLGLSTLAVGVIIGVVALLPYDALKKPYVVMGGLIVILRTLSITVHAMFRGDQRMGLEANSTSVGKTIELLVIIGAVLLRVSLASLFAILFATTLVHLLYVVLLARHAHYRLAPALGFPVVRHLVRGGFPFALIGISVQIYFQIATVMLGVLAGDAAVGLYRAAYNLVFALSAFSAAVALSLFASVAHSYQSDREKAIRISSQAIAFSLVLALPAAVGGTILAPQIIGLLYPKEFAPAAVTLQILLWWLPFSFLTNLLGHMLGAINRQKLVLMVSVINAAVNVALNILLIPGFADGGAATATVATEFVGFIILTVLVLRELGHVYELSRIFRIVLSSASLLPLIFLRDSLPVLANIAVGAALYSATLFTFKVVGMNEVRKMYTAVMGRLPSY